MNATMNSAAQGILRESQRLGLRLQPSTADTPSSPHHYKRRDVTRFMQILQDHPRHTESRSIIFSLQREMGATQPEGTPEDEVVLPLLTMQITNQNLMRLNNAIERAKKISRGITPGALSAHEALQIAKQQMRGQL